MAEASKSSGHLNLDLLRLLHIGGFNDKRTEWPEWTEHIWCGGSVVQSSTRTTQQHARHGFNPRMDRPPVARIDYPATW